MLVLLFSLLFSASTCWFRAAQQPEADKMFDLTADIILYSSVVQSSYIYSSIVFQYIVKYIYFSIYGFHYLSSDF